MGQYLVLHPDREVLTRELYTQIFDGVCLLSILL